VAADEPALDPKYAEPLTVSMNVVNAERQGQDVRSQYIKEKFNLTFDYVPVSWGDWNEKIRTWIATDDAPDLIWWDLKGAQANEFSSWADQGAFAPFKADYFNDRPNLRHVFENSPSIPALSIDGELFAWPSLRDNYPEAQNCYTSVWDYRRDWAKAVGLYNENDVYTWDEWMTLLRAILTEDPGQNGAANSVLVMPTWAFPHAPALFIGPPAAEGNETCSYIKGADGKYVWPPSLPEYRDGVKITYDMYQEGLIYKDNILFNANEAEDMIKAGLAFATYNVTHSLNSFTNVMLQDNVLQNREDYGIAMVISHDGNWYMTQTED
jgi:ABC-type glycerol-3-phosphate transport system substrate-binding protein